MTVVSVDSGNFRSDGAIKVEFSDGSSLVISRNYLNDELLPEEVCNSGEKNSVLGETARELSPGEEEAFRFAAACCRAEKIALRLVARAEQNSLTLTAKLQRRGCGAAAAKAVVSCLLDRNLLDDTRYAERWIRSRLSARKAETPRQLLASLGKKAIGRNNSLEALERVLDPETEYALLSSYLDKARFTDDKKAGVSRAYLKYEGFSSAVLDRYYNE